GGLSGFTLINGQAGTGKSRVLEALRDGYEADGARVIGMAWTNQVIADMRKGGYQNATTIAAELHLQNGWRCARGGADTLTAEHRQAAEQDYKRYADWMEEHGPRDRLKSFNAYVADGQSKARPWDSNTVLVIDEAAMLATTTLADVTAKAREARAKIIAAFD